MVDRSLFINANGNMLTRIEGVKPDPTMRRADLKNTFGRSFGRVEIVAACTAAVLVLTLSTATAFAKNSNNDALSVASTGTGSYICSPAGFGQKSRCYRR